MFVNVSNHSSDKWNSQQLEAARSYGKIVDIEFPAIDARLSKEKVVDLAEQYLKKICALKPSCVMVQGEFCFTYSLIQKLKEQNIKVVAACSERVAREKQIGGVTQKVSTFEFVQFREY